MLPSKGHDRRSLRTHVFVPVLVDSAALFHCFEKLGLVSPSLLCRRKARPLNRPLRDARRHCAVLTVSPDLLRTVKRAARTVITFIRHKRPKSVSSSFHETIYFLIDEPSFKQNKNNNIELLQKRCLRRLCRSVLPCACSAEHLSTSSAPTKNSFEKSQPHSKKKSSFEGTQAIFE